MYCLFTIFNNKKKYYFLNKIDVTNTIDIYGDKIEDFNDYILYLRKNAEKFCLNDSDVDLIKYVNLFVFFKWPQLNITEDKEFINEINIKIGDLSKDTYIEIIELVLYIFDKIINNENKNENELFKFINELINNDRINTSLNGTLMLNKKIKINSTIKSNIKESIKEMNNRILIQLKISLNYLKNIKNI
jgi:hypothetical protein